MSITLNYKVFGEGEPVIILHGLFGMLDNWQTFAKKLADHYMVYIIDQRDHGKSPHTKAFSYPLLAQDLHEFMTSQWIYKAKLIGHSMGGKTVMQFAQEYPDMVEQMVVVDIAPVTYEAGHTEIFEALFAVEVDTLTDRSEAEEVLSKYIDEVGVRQFLMKNLQRNKEGGYQWKMNLDLLQQQYGNILATVAHKESTTKSLFVRGELSNYITDANMETILREYVNGEIVTVSGAGHWVHAQKPKELLQLVSNFFEQSET